jgi:pyruvate dehydrogenase E2 component (dihydrolipoamide acetyltransferase)
MPTEILMPALSPTMTEGTLATWQKKEGDKVEPGDVIAEIETDKATMEVEAVDEGTLGRILVPAGSEGVAVNTPIGLLLGEGEDEAALDQAPQGGGGQSAEAADAPAEAKRAPASEEAAPAAAEASAPAAPTTASGERIFASPLARRLAQEAGLDLARIQGSGPRGRIVKADIERAQAEGTGKAAPAPERAPAAEPGAEPTAAPRAPAAPGAAPSAAPGVGFPPPSEPHEVVALDNMRKTIAKRLGEAKREIPHFYVTADVEIDALLRLRAELNGRADADYKLSVNDFVVKACAIALRRVPAANAIFGGDKIYRLTDVDVAVAVALEGGLITPVLRRVDGKGLATLSNEMKELAGRARAGKLMPEEYQGGAFCVSNLGMYGVKDFAAIINPPQAGILAVGVGEQRPVVKDGALAVATVMTMTLSVDHRVVDGAVAADMMRHIKAILEDPLALLL